MTISDIKQQNIQIQIIRSTVTNSDDIVRYDNTR